MDHNKSSNVVETSTEEDMDQYGETSSGTVMMMMMKKKGSSSSSSTMGCQAERCGVDLSDAKRYHRRHKVCDLHSKAPVVHVSGLRQRFCQQCSRFHELSEFDDAKRSCRRRLAGHNERRRKSSVECYGGGPPPPPQTSKDTNTNTNNNNNIATSTTSSYNKHYQIR